MLGLAWEYPSLMGFAVIPVVTIPLAKIARIGAIKNAEN
jgi:hypothetical protein